MLAARGHTVAFYTGARAAPPIEEQGWRVFPFRHLDEDRLAGLIYSADSVGVNWNNPQKLRPRLRALFANTVPDQFADLKIIIQEWQPDALITDPAMWAPFLLVHELYGLPVAVLSYACGCMLPGPGAPPAGLGLPLPRSIWGRFRNRLAGIVLDLFLRDTRRTASAIRRNHGLAPLRGPVIGLAARLPLYLVPSCPEFDYARTDLPGTVQYVGPLQWYPASPAPSWLDTLPKQAPLIHVTEGTLHVRDPFVLRAAAKAFAGLPVEAVMTTGGRPVSELDLGPLARNIRLVDWVNHDDLLPHTSVMVTTAGGGTVMAGLAAGVPMVVIPLEWDKAENAQRVVEAGAGIRISPASCNPTNLRRAVDRILENPSYRLNAQRISEILRRQGGPQRAATLLEEMLGRSEDSCGARTLACRVGTRAHTRRPRVGRSADAARRSACATSADEAHRPSNQL